MKFCRSIILLLSIVLLSGCEWIDVWRTPSEQLSYAKPPVKIISLSQKNGLTLLDADNKIIFISPNHYIAASIIDSGYKVGDILIPSVKGQYKCD